MKKALSVLVLLLVVFSAVAMADATITLTGGNLSQTNENILFPGFELQGVKVEDHPSTPGADWTVNDPRGTGAGWNFTILAGNFVASDNPAHIIPVNDTTNGYYLDAMVDAATINAKSGQLAGEKPSTQAAAMTHIGASAVQLVSAGTDKGMGLWGFKPHFQMDIPANTFAGTYTATFAVAINSAL